MGMRSRSIQNKIRLQHGLRWEREYPTPSEYPNLKNYALVALILILWAMVMTADYAMLAR